LLLAQEAVVAQVHHFNTATVHKVITHREEIVASQVKATAVAIHQTLQTKI